MKGISTVLAVILIVIIVVALVGLTYTFAVTLFGTAAGGAETQAAAVTERLQKSVTVVTSSCNATLNEVIFTIRNTGTLEIEATDLAAFMNGERLTVSFTPDPLPDGQLSDTLTASGVTFSAGNNILTISAPAASVDKTITCTN
jgi:archaellum component FlaF (FlaF/FlaG flagellin family)